MSGGEISTARAAQRHPLDWYVEQGWEWQQVVDAIGLAVETDAGCTIWDPAAGYGHSGSRLQMAGFAGEILLSDLVNNVAWDDFSRRDLVEFYSEDFLNLHFLKPRCPISIWMNPPYSYQDGILEAFCRKALALATHRVVVLAPLKWMSGGVNRSRFFREDFPPQQTLHFTTRPSMPPGDRINLMGTRAYRGGVIDYVAVVWDRQNPTAPGETREVWLPLLGERG